MGACLSVGNGTPRMSATMRRKARSVTLAGVKRTAQSRNQRPTGEVICARRPKANDRSRIHLARGRRSLS